MIINVLCFIKFVNNNLLNQCPFCDVVSIAGDFNRPKRNYRLQTTIKSEISMKILRSLFLTLIIISTHFSFAQQSELRAFAAMDSNVMLIGDRVTLHVGVDHNEKDEVLRITPDMPLALDSNFEIIGAGKWSRGRIGSYRDIVFTAWDTGLFRIPPVEFVVRHSNGDQELVRSRPLLVTVENPKGVDNMAAPAPMKEIIQEEMTFEDVLPWLIGVLAFVGVGLGLWFLYKKYKEKPVLPIVQKVVHPPHIIAERLLKELKIKQLWEKGQIKEYYSELSHILRGYLEEAYKIPALESTTDELMTLLNSNKMTAFQSLNKSDFLLEKVQDLLQTADLAKFAKVIPPDTVHDKFWSDACDIVEKTKPKPVEIVETFKD